jgi:hypothetical protein
MPAQLYRLRLGLPVGKTWIFRQIVLTQEKFYPISPFSRTKSDVSVDRIWVKGQEDLLSVSRSGTAARTTEMPACRTPRTNPARET